MSLFFDSHVHLFNEKYVIRSILTAKLKKLAKLIEKPFDFIKENVEKSFFDILNQYQKAGIKSNYLKLIVLTYDLDFLFQETYQDPQHQKLFFSKKLNIKPNSKFEFILKLEHKLNQILEQAYTYKFSDFLQETIDTYNRYPNHLYLFYFFDPRRTGALEYVKNFVARNYKEIPQKPFIGIKLYPNNGYSPLDPTMLEVFQYAEKYQIPITVHFSYGGFSTFANKLEVRGAIYLNNKIHYIKDIDTIEFQNKAIYKGILLPDAIFRRYAIVRERANILNHPILWQKVLEQFPNLRINFAHYGMGNKAWINFVIHFIRKYPNVYTDISYTSKKDLKYFKKLLAPNDWNKVLYGSDYILNQLELISTTKYFKRVRKILGRKTLKLISEQTPKQFLKLN